jgi:hypothetical protein
MHETINEQVSVVASFTHGPRGIVVVVPHLMKWRDKRYKLDKMGLYHPERRGIKQIHIFSFQAGDTGFRVELDPETLEWTLTQAYYAP